MNNKCLVSTAELRKHDFWFSKTLGLKEKKRKKKKNKKKKGKKKKKG